MRKRICSLLAVFALIFGLRLTAFAQDVPQERNDCAIEVVVRYDGQDITGGTLTAVKVGSVTEEDGNFYFARVTDGLRLEDVQSAAAVGALYAFYQANRDSYDFYIQTVTVTDGRAVFTGLSTGLYLILQEEAAEGWECSCLP